MIYFKFKRDKMHPSIRASCLSTISFRLHVFLYYNGEYRYWARHHYKENFHGL